MKTTINNRNIVIENPSNEVLKHLRKMLSYTDKSKQYQLKRMSKNTWSRNSPKYAEIQKQVYGSLITDIDDHTISIPSGFAYMLDNLTPDSIVDNRCETGDKISLPWKNKPFDLRDYQEEGAQCWQNNWRGLLCLATGLGKTLASIHAIRRIGKKTLIVCPSKSIANQFYIQLCEAFGDHRIGYMGGGKCTIKDITVGIVGTVKNNLPKLQKHGLGVVIYDETHHIAADTFYAIADELGDVGRMYGLTATDFRSDGKDIMITAGVGPVLLRKDVVWGVANRWLAEPYFLIRNVDTPEKNFPNDKIKNYKFHILNNTDFKKTIERDITSFINKGMSVLCLVDEVAHGEEISNSLGIPFATGKDKQSEKYIDDLNDGKIPGLIGTDSKLGEGTDTKNVDVLVMANFVASRGPVMQCIGRGLRKTSTKDKCIIVDYRPTGSHMLARHTDTRVKIYREITSNVKEI